MTSLYCFCAFAWMVISLVYVIIGDKHEFPMILSVMFMLLAEISDLKRKANKIHANENDNKSMD